MTIEVIDTNSMYPSKDITDGKHTFTIDRVISKDLGKAHGYVWTLEENDQLFEQVMFATGMKDLLKILGCKEDAPGKFTFDTDELKGKSFGCEVTHEPDKKGTIRQKFSKFTEEGLPF